eukprot:Skav210669  [mRNA]  locus=scaffold4685:17616:18254:- [translate_table: standard]
MPTCRLVSTVLYLLLLHPLGFCACTAPSPEEKSCLLQVPLTSHQNHIQKHSADKKRSGIETHRSGPKLELFAAQPVQITAVHQNAAPERNSEGESGHSGQSAPFLAQEEPSEPSMMIITQDAADKTVHSWSSTGVLQRGSVWTRCAGKLATSLLVLRLRELELLPALDEPIVPFLNLTGEWFPDWQQHPAMRTLTLRHVMAGVGGTTFVTKM